MKTANCRTCGAEVIWARMPSGKMCPFDAEETAAGGWALVDERGEVLAQRLTRAAGSGETGYVSHFATCPQAVDHRRG